MPSNGLLIRWSLVRFQPGSHKNNDLPQVSRLTLSHLSGFCPDAVRMPRRPFRRHSREPPK
jgi:hypothetical protein